MWLWFELHHPFAIPPNVNSYPYKTPNDTRKSHKVRWLLIWLTRLLFLAFNGLIANEICQYKMVLN